MLQILKTSSVKLQYSLFQFKRELFGAVLHSFDQKAVSKVFKRTLIFDSDISCSKSDTKEEFNGAQALPLDYYDHDCLQIQLFLCQTLNIS